MRQFTVVGLDFATDHAKVGAFVVCLAVLLGCRSTAPAWYTEPISEREPFRLILDIPRLEVHHGETVQVKLTLQNTTTRPLMGCLDYPFGFRFFGADKTNGGLITVSNGGCEAKNEFVLPPGRDLVWTGSITVPKKVSAGAATLWYYQAISGVPVGRHGSPAFYQKVESSPLDVTILKGIGDAPKPETSQPTVGAPPARASRLFRMLRAAAG